MEKKLTTPILFVIFNRPDTAQQVFDEIRKAKPTRLFVAADGPRKGVMGEVEKCQKARDIIKQIDWDCEVKALFRDKNLGCKIAVSSAINWFFENVSEGIILEDDCLPSQSFFWFCQELLEKYKNDTRIMHIAGATYAEKKNNINNYSYHFARVGGIWGWATWARAWELYEPEMESWPDAQKENILERLFAGEKQLYSLYKKWFEKAYRNTSTWDFQWTYSKLINSSINIMPQKNLVVNIGFGKNATHASESKNPFAKMERHELDFPLKHQKFIVVDRDFNYQNMKFVMGNRIIGHLNGLKQRLNKIWK